MNNITQNSEISSSAKLFNNIRIINSRVYDRCTIGDSCDIDKVIMFEKSELGRRNIIRDVVIGKGSYTGTNTIIKSADIGRYCCISWNVSVGGANHNYNHVSMYTDYWFKRTFDVEIEEESEQIRTNIGNDVWIGAGAIIIEGITIGDGAVIGAGSVVTKDVEPYSITAGVPAKQIKMRFDEETVSLLKQLQWWKWSEERIRENLDFLRSFPDITKLKQLMKNNRLYME